MERWDYDLNIKNDEILTPKNISFRSNGLNKKGYWFKCLEHSEHKRELKSIDRFVKNKKVTLNCNQCNSISITHSHLIKYFANKEDTLNYSIGSIKKVLMKCQNCGYEKEMRIEDLRWHGFSCPRCSDSISYPEKFTFNLLEQLNINFNKQLSKKDFNWCNNYRYDFYINYLNIIIETHGRHHYENIKRNIPLNIIQENDKIKEQLAKNNGIKNYIVIDCRKSDLEWIKNSIMNSKLPKLLNFKEEDINWLKCHEYACNSIVKIICNLWNDNKTILEITDIFKVNRHTIIKYLKQGVEIGWCDYDPKEEMRKGSSMRQKNNSIKIICLTTNEIFESIKEAAKKYNIYSKANISKCCRSKQKSAGKHLETGEPLRWMYYDDYLKNKNNIKPYENNKGKCKRKIIQLSLENKFINVWNSIKDAEKKLNISNISACCRYIQKTAGGFIWMYEEDYNNRIMKEKIYEQT